MHPSSTPATTRSQILPRPLRARLLVRTSQEPCQDNYTLDERERGLAFIQAKGWVIDPEEDVVQVMSGWKKGGQNISELVDLTTASQYDVVVVRKLGQFGARVPEVITFLDAMADANVRIASVTEGVYDLTIQMAVAQMMIVHGQVESTKSSMRVPRASEA